MDAVRWLTVYAFILAHLASKAQPKRRASRALVLPRSLCTFRDQLIALFVIANNFPKSTDLAVHSPEHLEFVAAQMNRRPRKTLGWLKPREALAQLLSESPSQPLVASTD